MSRIRIWENRALFALLVVFIISYCVLITASWYFYSQTGYFLNQEVLSLFPMLFDFSFIGHTFAPVGLVRLSLLVSVPLAFGIWFVVFAPRCKFQDFIHRYGKGMLLALLVGVILTVLPNFFLPPLVSGVYRASSFFALSPQWSLVWARLRYGQFEPELPQVRVELIERQQSNFVLPKTTSKQHVFLFVVEGLRADAIEAATTPTLHRLAQEGIRFANAYSQSTETSESMLSIITGRYPLKSSLRNRESRSRSVFRVYDGLAQAGYATGYIGEEWSQDSVFTGSPYLSYRFNPFAADYSKIDPKDNPFLYRDRGLGDYSLAVADRLKLKMLEKLLEKGLEEKCNVFSITYLMSPHFPYDQTDGVPTLHQPNQLAENYNFLWYPKQIAPIMRNRYLNTIAYIDSLLGRFLVSLRKQHQLNNSIIIVTGDHGQSFWEHGRVAHSKHLDEEAIRVPLIIWGASGYKQRWESVAPASHVDIAPTIYYIVGLPQHLSFQGESVLVKIDTAPSPSTPDRPLFISTQALMHEDAVIVWPWKFVRNLWGEGSRLYDLQTDSEEKRNMFDIKDQISRSLCECVVGFRSSQFHYYGPLNNLEPQYHPPRYKRCAELTSHMNKQEKFCGFK